MSPKTELLTAREVAALLRLKLPTVYARTRAGTIKALRIGRTYRYRRSDVLNRK